MIDKIVQEEQPDIIIGDMVRSTEYIKNYPIYRIADLDDRISLRYQRQLDYDISGINPYGAFEYRSENCSEDYAVETTKSLCGKE